MKRMRSSTPGNNQTDSTRIRHKASLGYCHRQSADDRQGSISTRHPLCARSAAELVPTASLASWLEPRTATVSEDSEHAPLDPAPDYLRPGPEPLPGYGVVCDLIQVVWSVVCVSALPSPCFLRLRLRYPRPLHNRLRRRLKR